MSSSSSHSAASAEAVDLEIGVGPAARTRRLARKQVAAEASAHPPQARRDAGASANEPNTAATAAAIPSEINADAAFALSPRHIDLHELAVLQQRSAVSFTVQNSAPPLLSTNQKEDAITGPSTATPVKDPSAPTSDGAVATKATRPMRQSWHPPVHVPLSHRKLVAAPSIFSGVAPFPPAMSHPPTTASSSLHNESKRKSRVVQDSPRAGGSHKLAKLTERSNQTHDLLSNRCVQRCVQRKELSD